MCYNEDNFWSCIYYLTKVDVFAFSITPPFRNAVDYYESPCPLMKWRQWGPGGCFTNVSRAHQNIFSQNLCIAEIVPLMRISNWNLHMCPKQCFGHTYKISAWNYHHQCVSGIVYFREIILESSRNVSETTPGPQQACHWTNFPGIFHMTHGKD